MTLFPGAGMVVTAGNDVTLLAVMSSETAQAQAILISLR